MEFTQSIPANKSMESGDVDAAAIDNGTSKKLSQQPPFSWRITAEEEEITVLYMAFISDNLNQCAFTI